MTAPSHWKEKVIVDVARLSAAVRRAIAHAHDEEVPGL